MAELAFFVSLLIFLFAFGQVIYALLSACSAQQIMLGRAVSMAEGLSSALEVVDTEVLGTHSVA